MTRPTVLDMDLVVVPREATYERMEPTGDSYSLSTLWDAMLSASPYPTAWDEVRKYVEGLERLMVCGMAELAASSPNAMEYVKHWEGRAGAAEARIAELEAQRDAAIGSAERQWSGWVKEQAEVTRLRSLLAEARRVVERAQANMPKHFRNWHDAASDLAEKLEKEKADE